MRELDPVQGVSWRNTKRHFKKRMSPVSAEGPRIPTGWELPKVKDAQAHIHPRSLREPKCGCGYPHTGCLVHEDFTRNFCYLRDTD